MSILSEQEVAARNCLKAGDVLVDPRYFPEHLNMEEKLKARCKACWAMREYFPVWVKEYIARWSKAAGWAKEGK